MNVLLWILRILALLVLLRLVLRLLFGHRRSRSGAGARRPPERSGGELVRDPHCGTYVPKSRALVVRSGDTAHYFCSETCRDAYARR